MVARIEATIEWETITISFQQKSLTHKSVFSSFSSLEMIAAVIARDFREENIKQSQLKRSFLSLLRWEG